MNNQKNVPSNPKPKTTTKSANITKNPPANSATKSSTTNKTKSPGNNLIIIIIIIIKYLYIIYSTNPSGVNRTQELY